MLIEDDSAARLLTNIEEWTLDAKSSLDSPRRCWRLAEGRTITRTTNQCPSEYLEVLLTEIDKLPAHTIHPALEHGLESEAQRLLPEISAEANRKFQEFIASLDSEYGFNINSQNGQNLVPFSDDIGPNLLTIIDQNPVILPEIPPLYLAPADWRLTMWRVSNYMTGPLPINEIADSEKIQFNGLSLSASELTPELTGLFYFHMARFILFFEAWEANPNAPVLQEFIRLFKGGIRPIESLVQ
ncbi:MAG: hypothetical protein AAGA83_13890 [Cyanobacteria bacterium P01_F01_bin.116]